jgi:hypothetical protein
MSAASDGSDDPGASASPAAGDHELPNGPGDSASAPTACDFDLGDPANLQAVWLTFQRERSSTCPVTETPFDLALAHRPAEDDSTVAEVQLACGRCGRTVAFSPPDANEVFGWAE